jgi:hypothetical protein
MLKCLQEAQEIQNVSDRWPPFIEHDSMAKLQVSFWTFSGRLQNAAGVDAARVFFHTLHSILNVPVTPNDGRFACQLLATDRGRSTGLQCQTQVAPATTSICVRSLTEKAKVNSHSLRRFGLTVDKVTTDIIRALQWRDRNETVCKIITSVVTGEITTDEVSRFYREAWQRIVLPEPKMFLARYRWSDQLDKVLLQLAAEVLGSHNRSEIFRILVALAGVRSGLLEFERIKTARIVPTSWKPPK